MGVLASPDDVIEGLGFGLAQLRVLLLAAGCWFADGVEISLVTSVSLSTAADFGLSDSEKGLLATVAFGGLAAGCFTGGWAGDSFGRKPAVMASYAGVCACGLATVFAGNYLALMLLRVGVGFSMGLGMGPSQVMISELTPAKWRMATLALRGFLFSTGAVYALLLCFVSDPTLKHLNWRWCFGVALIPVAAVGASATLFLAESPLYLAWAGRHAEAAEAFASMRRLNGCPDASIEYAKDSASAVRVPAATRAARRSCSAQLGVVLGPAFGAPTAAITFCSVLANLLSYGHSYGEPLLLAEDGHWAGLPVAAQLLVESLFTYIGCCTVFLSGFAFSRRNTLLCYFIPLTLLFITFPWSEVRYSGSWWIQVVFQVSAFGLRIVVKGCFLVVHQVSSELYPTAVVATGTSLCIGLGRIGATLAPMVFEWCVALFGTLTAFYYVMSIFGAFAVATILFLLPASLETFKKEAEEDVMAALPLKLAP